MTSFTDVHFQSIDGKQAQLEGNGKQYSLYGVGHHSLVRTSPVSARRIEDVISRIDLVKDVRKHIVASKVDGRVDKVYETYGYGADAQVDERYDAVDDVVVDVLKVVNVILGVMSVVADHYLYSAGNGYAVYQPVELEVPRSCAATDCCCLLAPESGYIICFN